MTQNKFTNLYLLILDKINNTLGKKGKEYSNEDNRFHNFDRAAEKLNCSREQALRGMDIKHVVSIDDLIARAAKGDILTKEEVLEKCVDHLNYTILLTTMLLEHTVEHIAESNTEK